MFSCSRNIQMLHNVKKNNIDIFEVHVSSFQIHVHVQLQIHLKCTVARPATFFRADWSWNHFHGHYFPGDDSSRAVVNYYVRKDVHLVLVNA